MKNKVLKIVTHSKRVIEAAMQFGWLPGARYTNLRDVRTFDRLTFLDIDWQNYSFKRHLEAARERRPHLTVARDIENIRDLPKILREAERLLTFSDNVILVPKDPRLAGRFKELLPGEFILGFSVPTKYGGTTLHPKHFGQRPVHLLGGRPDIQRQLASRLSVVSFDCNRFTLDARFGDYFDGETFRPHPLGGYQRCIAESARNISKLWRDYICSKVNLLTRVRSDV